MSSAAAYAGGVPRFLDELVDRFDDTVFTLPEREERIRIDDRRRAYDVVVGPRGVRLDEPHGRYAALLKADVATWSRLLRDVRGGMDAWLTGKLQTRGSIHLATGFMAATAGSREPGRLKVLTVKTSVGRIALMDAGSGPPVILLHGLGATKAEFLPTVRALAAQHRCIAVDLPGFGDSAKPIGAPYDAAHFARAAVAVLDALEITCAHVIGHSMGGRAALEVGLRAPDRVGALALMMPSMAWRRPRPWAPWLRLVRPELGLLQMAPRAAVEAVVRRLVPGSTDGWLATGVDEFLRAYLDPRGRAAFYAAARNIYLEAPEGQNGFWTRLPKLGRPALFMWGAHDRLVPLAFERHVRAALPQAEHVVVDTGHVPQLERPAQTHAILAAWLARHRLRRAA